MKTKLHLHLLLFFVSLIASNCILPYRGETFITGEEEPLFYKGWAIRAYTSVIRNWGAEYKNKFTFFVEIVPTDHQPVKIRSDPYAEARVIGGWLQVGDQVYKSPNEDATFIQFDDKNSYSLIIIDITDFVGDMTISPTLLEINIDPNITKLVLTATVQFRSVETGETIEKEFTFHMIRKDKIYWHTVWIPMV
ncbi:MAG: hypothetical protein KAU50_10155 [Candidatus Marinimicrobia bacterium]|nr:hypothetical protein [Candidatus Neomarinimicrobiota bacterium]